MGRSQNPTNMEIDLSLKIDADDDDDEQKPQVDEQVKEYNHQQKMPQILDHNKEEVPEAAAGEIEDDASVVQTSFQDNSKTKEVLNYIFIINNQIQNHNLFLIPLLPLQFRYSQSVNNSYKLNLLTNYFLSVFLMHMHV